MDTTFDKTCFVISPIGKEGTPKYQEFRNVLDYMIKPAIEKSDCGLKLEVLRADDIQRAGAFIRDILEYLAESYIVIADLTYNNPNVFYELGVRHALRPRTILIAKELRFIPTDLRGYRAITYDYKSGEGIRKFDEQIKKCLKEIINAPQRPDNPIFDFKTTNRENRFEPPQVLNETSKLFLTPNDSATSSTLSDLPSRVESILKAMHAEKQCQYEIVPIHTNGKLENEKIESRKVEYCLLPAKAGSFSLYLIAEGKKVEKIFYVSLIIQKSDVEKDWPILRELIPKCPKKNIKTSFVFATDKVLQNQWQGINESFTQVKKSENFECDSLLNLELWDHEIIVQKELEHGIRI